MKKILVGSSVLIASALAGLLIWKPNDVLSIVLAIIGLMCLIGALLCLKRKDVDMGSSTVAPESKPIGTSAGEGEIANKEKQGEYFEKYLENVSNRFGSDAAERVRHDVEAVIGASSQGRIDEIISKPENRRRAKGLVVGRIQSGKTQNYTGLITRAVDEGWNTIIVLTSNNTALEVQTIRRLRKDLSDCGLTEDKYVLIENFLKPDLPLIHDIEHGKVYVGFALKQADHLRGRNGNGKGVIGWLNNCAKRIENANIIVIDDESDNATQDTVKGAPDWSEQAIIDDAARVRNEGNQNKDEGMLRVADWICDIIEKEDIFDGADEQQVNALKNILAKNVGENEVRNIIRDYAGLLGLNRRVQFGTRSAESEFAPLLGGFVENYFTQPATSGQRGRSRGDDFRAILRWVLDVRKERSEINKAIRKLVSADTFQCSKLAYMGYTASPYANFLNEKHGADNPLELDFAQSMNIAPEYFGLTKIFGKDLKSPNPRMPIVKNIPESERNDVVKPLMDDVDVGLDAGLNYNYQTDDGSTKQGAWDSLKNAIKWAIVAAAVRRGNRIREHVADGGDDTRSERWTTMLVNLSRKIDDHGGVRDAIMKYLAHALEASAQFKEECLAFFESTVHDIDDVLFRELFPDYPRAVKNPDRASVEQHLEYVLGHIRVIALNSDASNVDSYSEYVQNVPNDQKLSGDWLWIVVGGNRISRGLTFDGLVSSYFDRDSISVNVDTLLQMGRWFGYRVGYELLPRVWMPAGAVMSMKEICALEEDLHSQLQDSFERHEQKPNPKMLAIARRLTARDNGMVREKAVENPVITREFVAPTSTAIDGDVSVVSAFLLQCGESTRHGNDTVGKIYTRLNTWESVGLDNVKAFFDNIARFYPETERESLATALVAMRNMGQSVDIVLSDPQNNKNVVHLGNGLKTHVHGISGCEWVDGGVLRLGKFSGQYDAWKAVVPNDVVESIERDFGIRANTDEAIAEMFVRKGSRGLVVRPVIQIGFVEIDKHPTPYVSVYCPGMKWLKKPTVSVGNVLGGDDVHRDKAASAQTAGVGNKTMQKPEYSLVGELEQKLAAKEYVATSALSANAKKVLAEVSRGRLSMPAGYGYWSDTRPAYENCCAVFRLSWARDAQEFRDKIIQEATVSVVNYVKARPTEEFQAQALWKASTKGRYNGILESNGKHILPQRAGDVEESRLKEYGIVCIANGQGRPRIRCT